MNRLSRPSPISRLAIALALAASTLVAAMPAAQAAPLPPVTVDGQVFAGNVRVAEADLLLNGTGMRAAFIYKVYAAGLYLPRRLSTPAAIYGEPGPKRLQLRMLMNGPAEEFAKAFNKGLAKSLTPEQIAAMKDRIDAFDRTLREIGDLHKGDVIDLDFLPARGLALTLNGKPRGTPVPGADLYTALLAIFLGDRPVDKALKTGLLGGPVS